MFLMKHIFNEHKNQSKVFYLLSFGNIEFVYSKNSMNYQFSKVLYYHIMYNCVVS
jgi:hypothetical protein